MEPAGKCPSPVPPRSLAGEEPPPHRLPGSFSCTGWSASPPGLAGHTAAACLSEGVEWAGWCRGAGGCGEQGSLPPPRSSGLGLQLEPYPLAWEGPLAPREHGMGLTRCGLTASGSLSPPLSRPQFPIWWNPKERKTATKGLLSPGAPAVLLP